MTKINLRISFTGPEVKKNAQNRHFFDRFFQKRKTDGFLGKKGCKTEKKQVE